KTSWPARRSSTATRFQHQPPCQAPCTRTKVAIVFSQRGRRRSASAADRIPAAHSHGDVADAGPGVEPGAERPERAVGRGARKPGESNCCTEELAALVEHAPTRSPGPPVAERIAGSSAPAPWRC